MFKVAFGDKFTEEDVIKEFNKEKEREHFEIRQSLESENAELRKLLKRLL